MYCILSQLRQSFSQCVFQLIFNPLTTNSPQVSRTLLIILADRSNAVVWMVSTRPLISESSSHCTNPLVTVPRAPITTGINITFMFHSFFKSQARSRYLSFFSLSFNITLWSARTAKSTILEVLFFFFSFSFFFFFFVDYYKVQSSYRD